MKLGRTLLVILTVCGASPTNATSPRGRYALSAETVVDGVTHLKWQRGLAPNMLNWAESKTYCAHLTLDGHTGWRLPSIVELVTLIDVREAPTAFDHIAFPAALPDGLWSSTPSVWDVTTAWMVGPNGSSSADDITIAYYVRCVHNG